jgi:hypothetical protein
MASWTSTLRALPRVHAKSQMDGYSQCIDYFDDPPVHFKPKIFAKGSLNISLDTPSYSVLPFFERAWSKGDLPKKDRKYLAFGKEKINSSKDSFDFVFLWVEVACLRSNGGDSPS